MAILGPFNFSGGYVTGYDFTSLPPGKNYATNMQNCRFRDGSIRPRWGLRNFATGLGLETIAAITYWVDTANSKSTLVATGNVLNTLKIADVSSFNAASSSISFADKTGAITAASLGGLTTFDSLNNILIGTGNSATAGSAPFKVTAYNANGAALAGSPPSGDCVKQVNNFLFISRNLSSSTTQSKVYWSNVNDPETWTGTNVLDFRKNDGEPVMALGSIGTDLYIFKKSSIGRLSTVTLTTSGAVTLGPLVTVIQGIGCCGPRALDNLPNGNIVFWGFNGHFYEFDGSTVVDRSRGTYPGKNVYDQWSYSSGGGSSGTSIVVDRGLSYMTNDINASVKVLRGANEVHISSTSTSALNMGVYELIYDFEQNIWQGTTFGSQGSGSDGGLCYTSIPVNGVANGNGQEFSDCLIIGTGVAGVVVSSGNFQKPYPLDTSGTLFMEIGTTVNLTTPEGVFIPRSLYITTNQTQASGSGKADILLFNVLMDFDQPSSLAATNIYTGTAGAALPNRLVLKIPIKEDSTGNQLFPGFLSIRIQMEGEGTQTNVNHNEILRLGPFWLSDEVIR